MVLAKGVYYEGQMLIEDIIPKLANKLNDPSEVQFSNEEKLDYITRSLITLKKLLTLKNLPSTDIYFEETFKETVKKDVPIFGKVILKAYNGKTELKKVDSETFFSTELEIGNYNNADKDIYSIIGNKLAVLTDNGITIIYRNSLPTPQTNVNEDYLNLVLLLASVEAFQDLGDELSIGKANTYLQQALSLLQGIK